MFLFVFLSLHRCLRNKTFNLFILLERIEVRQMIHGNSIL
ncbi:hypothetical protein NBRC111894_1305 [Sporolactobacillus inulinus]|uniref:Uncharacterized protein n=1 Tax=Sporolactobacillus inulinus TaxID=2078 RepID=A0A4Y1ZA11_9BACL|nr:hypothetical protein NBRC111894_1305 [Sporolactobacillus inulinus]